MLRGFALFPEEVVVEWARRRLKRIFEKYAVNSIEEFYEKLEIGEIPEDEEVINDLTFAEELERLVKKARKV